MTFKDSGMLGSRPHHSRPHHTLCCSFKLLKSSDFANKETRLALHTLEKAGAGTTAWGQEPESIWGFAESPGRKHSLQLGWGPVGKGFLAEKG